MTVSDVIEQARAVLGDTEEPYLWTDDELKSCFNIAYNEFVRQVKNLPMSETLTTVAGQKSYSLTYKYIMFSAVRLDDQLLRQVIYPSFENLTPREGKPIYFSYDGTAFYLWPTPNAVYTISITGVLQLPEQLDETATIPLPDPDALQLVDGICWRAYLKADSETYNPNASELFRQQFFSFIENWKRQTIFSVTPPARTIFHKGLL